MLRRILVAAAATATVAATFGVGVPAASAMACWSGTPPNPVFPCAPPVGRMCSFASNTDPTPEAPADTQTGQINVGPIFTRPTTPPPVHDGGVVKCTIQVGGLGVHSDPDSTAFITATDSSVDGVIIGAGVVSYISPSQVPVYLCTQYTKNGSTIYWTGAGWSTSSASPCGQALSVGTDDPAFDPVWDTLDTIGMAVDTQICPVLVTLAGDYPGDVHIDSDDGDIYTGPKDPTNGDTNRFWDCPAYGDNV